MTDAERKEYRRKWYQENKDRVKEYKHNYAIRKALKDIEAGKVVLVNRTELQEYGQNATA